MGILREQRTSGWKYVIKEQRKQIDRCLNDNPSLKSSLNENLIDAYKVAILIAAGDMNISYKTFPTEYPYSFEEIFNEDFFPG